jgi:glycosyltransferase involved in cell wall biosynthesis
MRRMRGREVVCFGAGWWLSGLSEECDCNIERCFSYAVDNNPDLWGTLRNIRGTTVEICSPQRLCDTASENTVVFITMERWMTVYDALERVPALKNAECYIAVLVGHCEFERFAYAADPAPVGFRMNPVPVIPRTIHYCWFGGKPIPGEFRRYIDGWRRLCSDYEVKEWNEDNYDISQNRYTREAHEAGKYGFAVDHTRLNILYNHGGIYLDTDVEVVKSFDELLYNDAFCGFHHFPHNNNYINLGLGFGAVKGHPMIKEMMAHYEDIGFPPYDEKLPLGWVYSPVFQTETLEKHGLVRNGQFQIVKNVAVYPAYYFDPLYTALHRLFRSPETYSVHHYAGTWVDRDRESEEKTKNRILLAREYEQSRLRKECGGQMSKPLVSWLMPAYNAEKTVRRALDSMLKQTYQNFEAVVVVEHACSDRTAAVCDEYSEKDGRIRVFVNEERLGIARSLNRGLDLCKGQYIARMDADDVSHPTRLEKQLAFMEDFPDTGILGTWCRVIRDDDVYIAKHPTDGEMIHTNLLFNNVLVHSTVMLRTEFLRSNRLEYPDGEAEDYALWAMPISKAKIACLPEILLDYHQNGNNATHVKFLEVRIASAAISKKAIRNELGVNADKYPDIYFGWRGNDAIPHDLKQFLLDGAKLLREIKAANARLHRFDDRALARTLEEQWAQTKRMARMSAVKADYGTADSETIDHAITELKGVLSPKTKAIIYGTGRYCTENLSKSNDRMLFEPVAFCDSDKGKQGTEFLGREIIAPERIRTLAHDCVFIASPLYAEEIRIRLISEFRISEERIWELPPADEIAFYCCARTSRNAIRSDRVDGETSIFE